MSYVLFVFDHSNGERDCLYSLVNHGATDSLLGDYASRDLDYVKSLADSAAAEFSAPSVVGSGVSAQYAIFRTSTVPMGRHGLDLSRFRSPVYVPAPCVAAALHRGWRVPEACMGDFIAPRVASALASVSAPAVYPINPDLPVELSDGTPCRVIRVNREWGDIRIRPLRRPRGSYARDWNDEWNHSLVTGEFGGSPHYLRLQNVIARPAPVDVEESGSDSSEAPAPAPVVRFEVRSGLNGTDRDTWGCVHEAESGKAAAAWVSERKGDYQAAGKSLVIVKVELAAPSVDWREREASRLSDGTYTPLPGDWARLIARDYPDHFPHVAKSDKRKVAFTETEGSGERDKQKVLSARAYMDRFFCGGGKASWYGYERERFISDMLGASIKPLLAPLADADALERVYLDCQRGYDVNSCMSHSLGDYRSPIHPVRVYAMGGDITMALLRGYGDSAPDDFAAADVDPDATWDSAGPIVARCLVWPEGKQYGRVYGDCDAARMLRTALEADGYRSGDLYGAKIAKVRGEGRYSHMWVMPYLDIGDGNFSDGGDYWTVGGDYCGGSTSGMIEAEEMETCAHCDEQCSADDLSSVLVGEGDYEQWCSSCCYDTGHCEHLGETVAHDELREFVDNRGWTVHVAGWLLDNGTIEAVQDTNGEWRHPSQAFTCPDCSEVFPIDEGEEMELPTGDTVTLCSDCHSEREASPELPLASAA